MENTNNNNNININNIDGVTDVQQTSYRMSSKVGTSSSSTTMTSWTSLVVKTAFPWWSRPRGDKGRHACCGKRLPVIVQQQLTPGPSPDWSTSIVSNDDSLVSSSLHSEEDWRIEMMIEIEMTRNEQYRNLDCCSARMWSVATQQQEHLCMNSSTWCRLFKRQYTIKSSFSIYYCLIY